MLIFDGHLDLAGIALDCDRDLTIEVDQIRELEAAGVHHDFGTATLSLPAMKRGGVGLCLSTLLQRCKPFLSYDRDCSRCDADRRTPEAAHAVARGQLAYYRLLESRNLIAIITTVAALDTHLQRLNTSPDTAPLGLIVTLEGADPITTPDELHQWHAVGLRTLMLAHFGLSRYCHGTPAFTPNDYDVPGPLTDLGRALLKEMAALDMPLDLSHTADPSFDEAADRFEGRIYTSHTACRAFVDIPRNHSDAQLRTIIARDGVIGLPLYNPFINTIAPDDENPPSTTLDHFVNHVDHICQLAGDARHVAIGSDLDGGFGCERIPVELDTANDWPKMIDALGARGYSADDTAAICSGNWLRFFKETLPA